MQSICIWASDNGLVPDDTLWTDPFSKLRLPEERSERTSFEIAELQSLFNASVFTEHEFPLGSHGAAGFWLPVLALFTGARQAELGSLTAANVRVDAETRVPLLYFMTERARGKRVKTDASERVVPVHPEVKPVCGLFLITLPSRVRSLRSGLCQSQRSPRQSPLELTLSDGPGYEGSFANPSWRSA